MNRPRAFREVRLAGLVRLEEEDLAVRSGAMLLSRRGLSKVGKRDRVGEIELRVKRGKEKRTMRGGKGGCELIVCIYLPHWLSRRDVFFSLF